MIESAEGIAYGTFLFHAANELGNPSRLDTFSMDLMVNYFNWIFFPNSYPAFIDHVEKVRPTGELKKSGMYMVGTNQRHNWEAYPEFNINDGIGDKIKVDFAYASRILLSNFGHFCDPAVDFGRWLTYTSISLALSICYIIRSQENVQKRWCAAPVFYHLTIVCALLHFTASCSERDRLCK